MDIISSNTFKIDSSEAIKIEFVARIRVTINPPYGKPFVLIEPHMSAHLRWALNFTAPIERCVFVSQGGTQGNSKNCYRPRIKQNLLISIQSSSFTGILTIAFVKIVQVKNMVHRIQDFKVNSALK